MQQFSRFGRGIRQLDIIDCLLFWILLESSKLLVTIQGRRGKQGTRERRAKSGWRPRFV